MPRELGGGDVAGVRAAADEVGRAGQDGQAVGPGGLGGLQRRRELRDGRADLGRLLDVGHGGVVVADQRSGRAPGSAA